MKFSDFLKFKVKITQYDNNGNQIRLNEKDFPTRIAATEFGQEEKRRLKLRNIISVVQIINIRTNRVVDTINVNVKHLKMKRF